MTRFWVSALIAGLLLAGSACTKGTPPTDATSNSTASNNSGASGLAILNEQSLKGDTERASLALFTARQAIGDSKWNDAATQIRLAQGEINKALARKPNLQEWEDLRSSLDPPLTAVEARGKDALARIQYCEQVVGAIKVKSAAQ